MCLSGIAHFLLSNMRSRGGHSDGVRKQAVCTLLGEGEGKQERKARSRHIMNELGSRGLGARHPLTGVQSPYSWAVPTWALAAGKLSKVLSPRQHLEGARHSVLL